MSTLYQWKCPLEACNYEQGGYQQAEQDCQTAFEAHLASHAAGHFVPYMLSGKWRSDFTLVAKT